LTSGSRILVVEDSPDIRVLIRMLLEAAGHEVLTAADGRAAVEVARAERPDLVLMDLSLPILSGWEAARKIKDDPATAAIPIVAVTAHAMHGDRERALAAGCDGFIAKPIDEETFEPLVRSYLRTRAESGSGAEAAPERVTSREPGRILVVDDHEEVATLIKQDLETEGHEVVVARTLDGAFATAIGERPFDLAIVDVMLGPDSGYDLTADLVSRSPEYLPVLLVTAGEIDREKGYAAGADDFIAKPLDAAELIARARSLIRVGRAIRSQGRAARERSEAYEKLAELYHKQGLTNEARTQYQVLADYYQKHDNAPSAIAIYQKMAQVEPNNPTYHVKLAEIFQQQQLVEKALGEYRVIAEMMIAHGRSQDAAQVYERALDISQKMNLSILAAIGQHGRPHYVHSPSYSAGLQLDESDESVSAVEAALHRGDL